MGSTITNIRDGDGLTPGFRDNKTFILGLTTVPLYTGLLVVSTKTKVGLVTEMTCCHPEVRVIQALGIIQLSDNGSGTNIMTHGWHHCMLNVRSLGCWLPTKFLFSCGCSYWHTIFKFADDTTILGLITDGDETVYRDEVSALSEWCYHNNLSLNISKTKEMIVDYRKLQRGGHSPLYINGAEVERVSSVRFLGVHLTDDLSWSFHTNKAVRSARQRLFFLRRLRKFGLPPDILTNFYRCTIESILTACITVWYGSCTACDRKALKRVVRTAESIIGSKLPDLQDIYRSRCLRKIQKIRLDCGHPAHGLFTLLPSGRRYHSIQARTNRLMNSFYPQAIRFLNKLSPSGNRTETTTMTTTPPLQQANLVGTLTDLPRRRGNRGPTDGATPLGIPGGTGSKTA
ncbi:hypothetical protein NFI96_002249 [Prochilodus magdalenae]|nr:hypothetical protein NFI96_002249 [Prochilodus magdalenae]